jgi:ABC-type Fe3+/spermidine/putrescine transport system ATPase subunit
VSAVELTGLTKRFAPSGPPTLDDVTFAVADGSIACLLGPSGSGKSTILGCIAGLVAPDAGRVDIGGRDQSAVPAHRRPATLLMQQAQLFGHLTVAENVEFGLRVRRVDRVARSKRARDLLELVGLAGFERRSPHNLSGGEQQRVALARALAVDPEVLLADEPLASLDPEVRRSLQDLLVAVQRELGTTILLVTHDVGEALALADQLVVLVEGQIQAVGEPRALLADPKTLTAARLLGLRNVIWGRRTGGQIQTPLGWLAARPSTTARPDADADLVPFVIDPARVELADGPGPNVVGGRVVASRLLGADVELRVETGDLQLALVAPARSVALGERVLVRLPADHLVEVHAGRSERPAPT